MFYIYILKSQRTSSFYIGSCENVEKRLEQHNKGLVRSTKRYIPWDLVHLEMYDTLSVTRKRELQIKSWKSRGAIGNLFKIPKFYNEDSR